MLPLHVVHKIPVVCPTGESCDVTPKDMQGHSCMHLQHLMYLAKKVNIFLLDRFPLLLDVKIDYHKTINSKNLIMKLHA